MKKVSWLRILRNIYEVMNANDLTEYEISVETVYRAMIDGGYPTTQSMDEVAAKFNLQVEWVRMAKSDEIPPIFPKYKIRRIDAASAVAPGRKDSNETDHRRRQRL